MDDNKIFITDENNEEKECEILFTYHNEETGKDYVVLYPVDQVGEIESVQELKDLDIDYYAFEYQEVEEGRGDLLQIETEEEYELMDDIIDQFFNGDTEEDN